MSTYLGLQRLRVLLRKELKNSDVGSLGRIVLPKVRFYLIHDGLFSRTALSSYIYSFFELSPPSKDN